MIITGRAPGEQTCWSEPWTGFSARTGSEGVRPAAPQMGSRADPGMVRAAPPACPGLRDSPGTFRHDDLLGDDRQHDGQAHRRIHPNLARRPRRNRRTITDLNQMPSEVTSSEFDREGSEEADGSSSCCRRDRALAGILKMWIDWSLARHLLPCSGFALSETTTTWSGAIHDTPSPVQ